MATTPPDYVLEAFGVSGSPQRAGRAWDNGCVYESLVLSEVRSPAQAMWSAKVRSLIDIDGVAVASSFEPRTAGRLSPGGKHAILCPVRWLRVPTKPLF